MLCKMEDLKIKNYNDKLVYWDMSIVSKNTQLKTELENQRLATSVNMLT